MIVVCPAHIHSIFGPYLSDGSSKNSSTVQVGLRLWYILLIFTLFLGLTYLMVLLKIPILGRSVCNCGISWSYSLYFCTLPI